MKTAETIFSATIIMLIVGVFLKDLYLNIECDNYGEMRGKPNHLIKETCYVKQGKAWVTKAAYDEKVDNLYKQDRLQVLKRG